MPIRFRCAYCNQLMGIARRKSGTVVRCPTCSGQVVVPAPDNDEPDDSPPPTRPGALGGGPPPNLFERSDIDEILRPNLSHAATVAAPGEPPPPQFPPTGAWGTGPEAAMGAARLDAVAVAAPAPVNMSVPQAALPVGIVLSSGKLTFLAVAAVLLLGVAFGAGVYVGKFLLQ